jgi:hypothetical protein
MPPPVITLPNAQGPWSLGPRGRSAPQSLWQPPVPPTAISLVTPQQWWAHAIGWPITPGNQVAFSLNAAVNFCGLSFVISDNKILNTIRTNNTVTASLGVNDAHCDLYDDYYGVPGNLLFSSNTLSSAIATGYNTWTGFTYPLIAMKKYWAVWKNLNGVPGTNFFSVNVAPGIEPWFPASGNWAWQKATSVNSGTSWTQAAGVGLRLGFSDGTYVGMLCNGGASSLDIGSQNDNLIYDFYSGSGATRTKLGTTGPIPRQLVSLSTPSWVPAYFVPQFGGNNPAVNMTPGQSYTVVAHGDGNYKSQFGSKFTCPANVSPNVRGIAMLARELAFA